jgi:hypothetical protein
MATTGRWSVGILLLLPFFAGACAYMGKTRLQVMCCREGYESSCAERLYGANVFIDDVRVGSCGETEDGIYVAPGTHRVAVHVNPTGSGCCFGDSEDIEIPASGKVKHTFYLHRFPH